MSFASFSLALLFTACSQSTGQQGGGEYKLITVEKTDQTLTSAYTAVIKGRQSVEIRPQVSGTLTDICVNEGAKVHKGQTLFIIDQVPYQSLTDGIGKCEECGSCRCYGPTYSR